MSTPEKKRVGHPGTSPWESLPSMRAGLPRDRAEWLAIVLPAIDAGRSHPEVAQALSQIEQVAKIGETITASSVLHWHRKLVSYQEAGELPEHPQALPARQPGWREGAPLPSLEDAREGGRKGSQARWGKKSGKARKAAQKSGKGKVTR